MTINSIQIRPASELDLDHICALSEQINQQHHLAAPHTFVGKINREFERLFWRAKLELPDNIHLIARCDNAVLGYITASVNETMGNPFLLQHKICRIGTIVVAQHSHRLGVGKALMDAAIAWGAQQRASEIRLEVFDFNTNAMAFYEQLGFVVQSHIMQKNI